MKTMSEQNFANKIDSSILNEICFFIFSEFIDVEEDSYEELESVDTNDSLETSETDQQFDDISSSISSLDQKEDETINDKAQRLKERYKYDKKVLESGRKTGVSVRRVTT